MRKAKNLQKASIEVNEESDWNNVLFEIELCLYLLVLVYVKQYMYLFKNSTRSTYCQKVELKVSLCRNQLNHVNGLFLNYFFTLNLYYLYNN